MNEENEQGVYGSYRCTATNKLGNDAAIVNLKQAGQCICAIHRTMYLSNVVSSDGKIIQ